MDHEDLKRSDLILKGKASLYLSPKPDELLKVSVNTGDKAKRSAMGQVERPWSLGEQLDRRCLAYAA